MMKKRFLSVLAAGLFILTIAGSVNAALTTIGTATYDDGSGAAEYNLIWDDDNNGKSVIWLDYTHSRAIWSFQKSWAAGLDAQLTYNIDPAYNVSWDDPAWRLPSTVDGPREWGYDGTTTEGYNITTSEMGHLYYTELGNLGSYDTSGNCQPGNGLNNTGDFNNLIAFWYWSGTEYARNPDLAWFFHMSSGSQGPLSKSSNYGYGLAVRSGQVSAVPVPGAIWLLGSGLAGVVTLVRRRKGNSV